MAKRLFSCFLVMIFVFALTACGDPAEDASSSQTTQVPESIELAVIDSFHGFGEQADTLLTSIKKDFWMLTENKMGEKIGSRTPITLWGYSAYMEAVGHWFKLNPDNADIKAEYIKVLDSVEAYRCGWRSDDLQVYQCWAGESQAECFYDDDVWVVLEFINAYHLLKDEHWLSQAKGTIEFCYSGWDDKCGGGVYWKEDTKAEKNTCINAPLALASCQLYEVTGDEYYLDWAKKLYTWTKDKFLDESDYTFWDNVRVEDGQINKAKYTYNTGNMIGAAAALYAATGEEGYLTDARNYAEGAYKRFGEMKTVDKMSEQIYICDGNAWFGGSLLKGYLLLAEVDPTLDEKYIHSYHQTLAYATTITVDPRGYMKPGWVERGVMTTNDISLLDQSGIARLLLMLQEYSDSKTN